MTQRDPRGSSGALGESALLARLRAGEEQAFEELVRRFGGQMLAVARRFLFEEADAQDVLQDAFLSAFRALPNFDGKSRLSTWLHRIVVNAALMRLRTRRRHPEQSIEGLLPAFREDGHRVLAAAEPPESASRALQREELRELIRSQIERLPESYRNVLLLRDIEELDTAETARFLRISEGAVKTRLHRARQALRTLLDAMTKGERP
jgi:RNA polymerase sigma-70 factor (ECF subfamily)